MSASGGASPRPEVVTVYEHSDGYPDGAVCWITKTLEHAWPLPRFEADEFAAAFVAANKPSVLRGISLRRRTCSKAASRIDMSPAGMCVVRSLAIQRSALTRLIRFSLAHKRPVLRASIPALTLEVIDAAGDVQPDHDVSWTVLLCCLLLEITAADPKLSGFTGSRSMGRAFEGGPSWRLRTNCKRNS